MQFAPGDVVEIETPGGLTYAQVTHVHPAYPEIVRFIKGLYSKRPSNLADLAKCPTQLVTLFPLAGAIDMQLLAGRKVGVTAIPNAHRSFPTFKMPIRDKQGGVFYWWLWSGDGLSFSVDQDGSLAEFPIREVISVDELMRRISPDEIGAAA